MERFEQQDKQILQNEPIISKTEKQSHAVRYKKQLLCINRGVWLKLKRSIRRF